MNKTSDQIFDEFESRSAEILLQKKKRFKARVGDSVGLALPFIAFLIWSFETKLDAIGFAVGLTYLGFAFSELSKRWTLEDRIDHLEEKK